MSRGAPAASIFLSAPASAPASTNCAATAANGGEYTEAVFAKATSLYHPPPVLALALKRFSALGGRKVDTLVECPLDGLDLAEFSAPVTAEEEAHVPTIASPPLPPTAATVEVAQPEAASSDERMKLAAVAAAVGAGTLTLAALLLKRRA